jgi:23S rRNA-/tRNA-specific pseudouridylate synthase
VFAKNADAHKALSGAFESRRVQKTYLAAVHGSLVEGNPLRPAAPRGRGPGTPHRHRQGTRHARGHGLPVLGSYGHISILERSRRETGRTHQIRVHLAALGHSIIADSLYGDGRPVRLSSFKRGWRGDPHEERPLIDRLALHAAGLSRPAFKLNEVAFGSLELAAPLPRDLAALITQLEKSAGEDFDLAPYR